VGWSLEPFIASDFGEIDRFYRNVSGGLFLKILRLDKSQEDTESLSQLYARNGFKRSYQSFSLKGKGMLKAVLIVNQSDSGLSLSDFLNGIKIIVNDADGLPWEVLSSAISQLVGSYTIDKIPILVYPSSYVESKEVSSKKQYTLWVMDVNYGKELSEYFVENTKHRFKSLIRFLVRKYLKNDG
jgi:hypothetical protein